MFQTFFHTQHQANEPFTPPLALSCPESTPTPCHHDSGMRHASNHQSPALLATQTALAPDPADPKNQFSPGLPHNPMKTKPKHPKQNPTKTHQNPSPHLPKISPTAKQTQSSPANHKKHLSLHPLAFPKPAPYTGTSGNARLRHRPNDYDRTCSTHYGRSTRPRLRRSGILQEDPKPSAGVPNPPVAFFIFRQILKQESS